MLLVECRSGSICNVETPDLRVASLASKGLRTAVFLCVKNTKTAHRKSCTQIALFSTDLVVSGLLMILKARIEVSGQPGIEGRCHHVGEVKIRRRSLDKFTQTSCIFSKVIEIKFDTSELGKKEVCTGLGQNRKRKSWRQGDILGQNLSCSPKIYVARLSNKSNEIFFDA